jgi:hypothetical protein
MLSPFIQRIVAVILISTGNLWAQDWNVRDLKLTGDGKTDDTAALQAALDAGKTCLYFPLGTYLLGTVKIPADSLLSFDPRARIIPNADKIVPVDQAESGDAKKPLSPLFVVAGDRVCLEGLRFDFADGDATGKGVMTIDTLVYAAGVSDPVVKGFYVKNSRKKDGKRVEVVRLFEVFDCRNVVLENSGAENLGFMIWTTQCANVSVRGNWMIGGAALTTFAAGSENLRHQNNWSRNVGYQCVWRGGSPDPSRKAPKVPLGTANVVRRGSKPSDADFVPHTQGIFDVIVQNNYAEYGTTLCWGNKGRQVLIDGNIARFMFDYSYGSEGDENTVFSNNISINSAVAGFTCLYWGEKVLITGNMVIVRHEAFRPDYTDKEEGKYMGQFVRLHHGPPNPEDKYGSGSVSITGNLFVNELADRPSGISIEAGRDVLLSGNKIINGLVRKADEFGRVKAGDEKKDSDEFASSEQVKNEKGETFLLRRNVGSDLSRVTIMDNEFISRQSGDKPVVIIEGSVATAILRNNIFRKEPTYLKFTDAQREIEKTTMSRYMLYALEDVNRREYTNSQPSTTITLSPFTAAFCAVQDNFVMGWKNAIAAVGNAEKGKTFFVVTGNTSDGTITVKDDGIRIEKKVEGNIDLPQGVNH